MPQARKKPASSRAQAAKTAVRKGMKGAAKSGARQSAKRPPRKGSARNARKGSTRQSLTAQEFFFYVFAVPQGKLHIDQSVAQASGTRGTPPIRVPKPGMTLIGVDCKILTPKGQEPPLQFIQSPVFRTSQEATAYLEGRVDDPDPDVRAEGPRLHEAADNDILYKVIVSG